MEIRTYLVDKTITNGDFTYPIYFEINIWPDSITCHSRIDGVSFIPYAMTRAECSETLNDIRRHGLTRIDWTI